MNEFWTTILNSPVLASIVESLFVCGVVLLLQHLYDKKLENHKEHVQKKIDEHQIQFSWWHQEKVKAIKELHANAGDLYCSLIYLHRAESNPPEQEINNNQEEIENGLKKQVAFYLGKTINDWLKLRLFLDDDEDKIFYEFNSKTKMWFNVLLNPNQEQRIQYIEKNQAAILTDIDNVMDKLRTSFQASLKTGTTGAHKQNNSETKEPFDQNGKKEQKPSTE